MRNKIIRYVLGATLMAGAVQLPAAMEFVAVAPAEPIKHKVQKGETLYAISRKYQVSVAQIQAWNNLSGPNIREGQVLLVSAPEGIAISKPAPKPIPAPKVNKNLVDKPVMHTVSSGETMFAIARKYQLSVTELKALNGMETVDIRVGQKLRVGTNTVAASPETQPYDVVNPTPVPKEKKPIELPKEVVVETKPLEPKVDPKPIEPAVEAKPSNTLIEQMDETNGEASVPVPEPELTVLAADPNAGIPNGARVIDYVDEHTGESFKRVEEKGTAGLIDDFSTDQAKFYAFHKYLPEGSYIRVDHPERRQSILVEVINRLPMNDSYTIRLTSKCMDYLRMEEVGAAVVLRYVIPASE